MSNVQWGEERSTVSLRAESYATQSRAKPLMSLYRWCQRQVWQTRSPGEDEKGTPKGPLDF